MNESSRKTRPKSQVMSNNSSTSPIPPHNSRKNGSSDSLPSHRYENEWEMRKKELSELKSRCSQMEKTMRWWSDCTDNWRKKWSEVKTERNQAREELKATKAQLAQAIKQLDGSQPRDGNSKLAQSDVRIYSNVEPPPQLLPRSSSAPAKKNYTQPQPPLPAQNKCNLTDNGFLYKPNFAFPQNSKHKYESENQLQGASGGHRQYQSQASKSKVTRRVQTDLSGSGISVLDRELVSLLEEKVSHLKFKLDEVTTRLSIERQEKSLLIQRVERLQRELGDLNDLYESLKKELCEINGKEFTESEIESYADEKEDIEDLGLELESDAEENRLIEQLAQDEEEADADEADKHTPTGDVDIHKSCLLGQELANGDGDGSSDTSSIRDTNNTDPSVGTASPQCDRSSIPEQETVEIQLDISKDSKPVNESLVVDEEIERKLQQLKGQLKAINFQGENHEKLDLRCFADLADHDAFSAANAAVESNCKPVIASNESDLNLKVVEENGIAVNSEKNVRANEPEATIKPEDGNNGVFIGKTTAEELNPSDPVQITGTNEEVSEESKSNPENSETPESVENPSTPGAEEKVNNTTLDTCSVEIPIRTTDL